MKLSARFLLLITGIFVIFMSITWFLSGQLISKLNQQWGEQYIEGQVLFDKARTLSPLMRELALAKQMAADPAIIEMALNEQDPEVKRRGIAAMERYRLNFHDQSYFAAFMQSGNYYFNDSNDTYSGKQLRYMLSPSKPMDQWFYSTVYANKPYQINTDTDIHLKVTKVWLNVLIKKDNKVLGILGTGMDLTDLIKQTVAAVPDGVDCLLIDERMAIQLNTDPDLIDFMTITKNTANLKKVDLLFKNRADIEQLQQAMKKLKKSPNQVIKFPVQFQGTAHLLGVTYLPELNWFDLTLVDYRNSNLHDNFIASFLSFAGLLLFALLIMNWAIHVWIIAPLDILKKSTEDLSQKLTSDSTIVGATELTELSLAFTAMSHAVIRDHQALEAKVKERTEELKLLTETDPLTGLLNRRGIAERFELENTRLIPHGGSLGFLLFDLDHFKKINDTYGHTAGDEALREFARTLQHSKKSADHAARMGGEEFLLLLPDCKEKELLAIAERIRVRVSELVIHAEGQAFSLTVSVGAYSSHGNESFGALMEKIDHALYAAKHAGRNRVQLAE